MCHKNTVLFLCFVAYAFAAPTDIAPEKLQPTVIPIVSQSEEFEPNGTYKFSYETGNGIKREEIAYEKVLPKTRKENSNEASENEDYSDEIHVQEGSYSYTAPDGTVITLRYIADENGFRPIGDHLPKAPVAISASASSAEKSGRSLKSSDSSVSASAPVQSESVKPADAAVNIEPPTAKDIEEPAVASANSDLKQASAVSAGSLGNDEPKPESKIDQAEKDNAENTKNDATEPATESEALKTSDTTTPSIDVSSEQASTPVPVQPTDSEQGPTASAEQAFTSEQPVSTEVSEPQSSTAAPEQSSSIETIGQSTPAEPINQPSEEEIEQSSTKIPQSEESVSTTISN